MRNSLPLAAAVALSLTAFAAASAPRPLSDAQLDTLAGLIDLKGVAMFHPGGELLGALGLPPGPEPGGYGTKYWALTEKTDDGIEHHFGIRPGRPDYLFVRWTKTDIQYIRTDADLKLIADALYRRGDDRATIVPPEKAADALNQELAAWAAYADGGGKRVFPLNSGS